MRIPRAAGRSVFLGTLLCAGASPLAAADIAAERRAPLASGGVLSAEVFTGYLTGQSRELVYNVPGDRSKLSQLNWQIDRAAVIGAAAALRVDDRFSIRGRGWVHAGSDNAMDDFDWLFGYAGFNSWSDWSHHGDTRIGKAYELDVSGALGVFADASTRIEALAGYRLLTLKWNAFGGSFVYSTNGFRDDLGTFPANELQIAYQQWWHAPYLGVAVAHEIGPVRVSAEFAASPLVSARDRDHHVDIAVFKEAFAPSGMASVALSAEWAFADRASLVGRAEFQRFFEARGGIKEIDVDPPGFARYPRPAAGADHESLLLSVGLKARL